MQRKIKGPSHDVLRNSLHDGDHENRKSVLFMIDDIEGSGRRIHRITINGMEREDDTGQSWNFKGYFVCGCCVVHPKVQGYYNTRERAGWIETFSKEK